MDYNNQADSYARLRKTVPLVLNEIQRVCNLSSESKVLEVGSGTGSQIAALVKETNCNGWGVDPSINMMNYAVSNDKLHFMQGYAEELPFEQDFFDFVFTINVVHHLKSTFRYFQEALRVLKPNGIICTATDSEKKIRNRKPLATYWPGTVAIDLKRYPSIEILRTQMADIGFSDIKESNVLETFEVTDIGPYREKAFSCLRLISEEEHLQGLRQLEVDLQTRPVEGIREFTLLWGKVSRD